MAKMGLDDVSFKGKRALMRVDFNVPVDNGSVADDTRIAAALPSIKHILKQGGSVILMSHLGRPKEKGDPAASLAPVGARLSQLLGGPVKMMKDCIGPEVEKAAKELKPGEVMLLENVRFYKEEEKNDPVFAKKLAALGDLYVNDAFGTAHRAHASTEGVTRFIKPCVAGRLMQKELEYFGRALADPKRPFVAVLGGAKVSDKIPVIENLLTKVNTLLIGGAMAYTFLKARGVAIGRSLCEDEHLELTKKLAAKAAEKRVLLLLPSDHLVARSPKDPAGMKTTASESIEADWLGVDIGPRTVKAFAKELSGAGTVVWNGPMGIFEVKEFACGTMAVAKACAESKAVTIVGGGDSVSAVNASGLAARMSHISTGGGASLELLEGKALPGVVALTEKK